MENENLIYVTLRLSKYDAHILITENVFIFCRQLFRQQKAHLDIINRTRFGNANKVVDRTAYFIELGRQNNHLLYQDV